jgi:NAD(P)H-dependent FMN reductase
VTTPLLQIIIGSTRPGRVGGPVGHWFADKARADDRFEIELIDLAEVGLPLLDEPNHPRLHRYTKDHTKAWSERIARGDAYVFVIPEYNYSMNAATKNAIDYLFVEWAHKPLGIVSYGGIGAGLRAAQVLKQVGSALSMLTMPDIVSIPWVATMIEDGRFVPTPPVDGSSARLLDEIDLLLRGSAALR